MISIDGAFHAFRNVFYWFSSIIHEELIFHNISEKGHTIHKAKDYTSFLRPEQGLRDLRHIYGCIFNILIHAKLWYLELDSHTF